MTPLHAMSKNETTTSRPALKVRVEQARNMFGKRQNAYTAHLGETGWTGQGTCKAGAEQMLFWELQQAKRFEYTRRYIRIPGATFALYWAGAGWCYDIIHDDYTSGIPSSCLMGNKTSDEAFAAMQRHAAQMREQIAA